MAGYRSIRTRAKRRKLTDAFELQLTSMIDVLVIILVFLLKSTVNSATDFELNQGVEMPVSRSIDVPPNSFHLVITPEAILFDNVRVAEFEPSAEASLSTEGAGYKLKASDVDEGGRRIRPLFDALSAAKSRAELMRAQNAAQAFDGVLAVQADRRVTYDVLRKIMYTSAASGFRLFNLLANNPTGEISGITR